MNSNFITTGGFFVFILLSGFWLSRTGKPYSMFIITVHKLIGLATGIYLLRTIYRVHQDNPLDLAQITSIVISVLFFIGLVATGSLLSADKPMPDTLSTVHKILPNLTVLSTGATIYLLL